MRKNRRLGIAFLAGAVWLAAGPGRLFGQQQTWAGQGLSQMVEAAHFRFGFLRANAALELSNAGYDSDIFYGFLSEPDPDITAFASAPVQLLFPVSKKFVLDVSDTPEYAFYLSNQQQRAWNNTFNGLIHVALRRLYVQAGGSLSNVQERISPELELYVRLKTDSLKGMGLWQASSSLSLALLYDSARYDYEDVVHEGTSLAERLNRNESYLDLISYIQTSAKARFSLDGQYSTYRFTEDPTGLRDAQGYALFAGVEFIPVESAFGIARGIRGAASIGYQQLDVRDPQAADGSGLIGQASLAARIMRRTTGQIFFSRGFQFSIYSGVSYYLATDVGAGLTRYLSRRSSLTYNFTYSESAYPETVEGGTAARPYRYLTHDLFLNLRLARPLTVTFQGTFGQRDSGPSVPIKNRFFVGVSLVYGFRPGGITGPRRGGTPQAMAPALDY